MSCAAKPCEKYSCFITAIKSVNSILYILLAKRHRGVMVRAQDSWSQGCEFEPWLGQPVVPLDTLLHLFHLIQVWLGNVTILSDDRLNVACLWLHMMQGDCDDFIITIIIIAQCSSERPIRADTLCYTNAQIILKTQFAILMFLADYFSSCTFTWIRKRHRTIPYFITIVCDGKLEGWTTKVGSASFKYF